MQMNIRKLTVSDLINDYVSGFNELNINLVSVSYFTYDSKILIWAVVHDYDVFGIDQLFILESIINSNYIDYGFRLTTIIMKAGGDFPAPSQFRAIVGLTNQTQSSLF